MGTPDAAKLFLESLTGCNLPDVDFGDAPCFDTLTLSVLRDIHASPGRVTCIIPVDQQVQNRYGTLHGGCIATLVDVVGSAALVTVSERSGVSLSITVDYLRPGKGGEDVLVDAEVVKVGGLIATINVNLKAVSSGELIAQGKHIKFLTSRDKGIPTAPLAKPRSKL